MFRLTQPFTVLPVSGIPAPDEGKLTSVDSPSLQSQRISLSPPNTEAETTHPTGNVIHIKYVYMHNTCLCSLESLCMSQCLYSCLYVST